MENFLYGSICLSDIPRSQMRRVVTRDGREKVYLNIQVAPRREPRSYSGRVYTHYVSCAPRREERKEGESYFIGDLQEWRGQGPSSPSPSSVHGGGSSGPGASASSAGMSEDLPF